MEKIILGATIGDCVHVGGIQRFLRMAEDEGYATRFLGTAVPDGHLFSTISETHPDMVALSYRLTPSVATAIFRRMSPRIRRLSGSIRFIFGGTPPVAAIAKKSGLFFRVFDGTESLSDIRAFLAGKNASAKDTVHEHTLESRIQQKYPYPLLRHHFGRPTVSETVRGAARIAQAGVLDVLSVGPDQNAQEHFFHPERMDRSQDGAGGVPLRTPKDLAAIYRATRAGNFPLVRCYAGTNDLTRWAEMSVSHLHNAWGAIPLYWYSTLDGRSGRPLAEAIAENCAVMRWYAEQGIPVEVNESHQWSLRSASDAVAVAVFYLAAYNAKAAGVRRYVAQFMFNTPGGVSGTMDLAKMLAKKSLLDELVDDRFSYFIQVRAGLLNFSADANTAKGQMAASAVLSMAMKPHILHVVGYSEGDHAVTADELIESCGIAHGVLRNCMDGMPDMTVDRDVQRRIRELRRDAKTILKAIHALGGKTSADPFADPVVLSMAVERGILDAPDLKSNLLARGAATRIINGACVSYDGKRHCALSEKNRLAGLKD
ncbi:MAG: cobalamin B12-binding domain-containing protein [Spirochaetes bacterium]|nr:cobalamin B12-binding domain-containing protein [Spirochaetota bacterium]